MGDPFSAVGQHGSIGATPVARGAYRACHGHSRGALVVYFLLVRPEKVSVFVVVFEGRTLLDVNPKYSDGSIEMTTNT